VARGQAGPLAAGRHEPSAGLSWSCPRDTGPGPWGPPGLAGQGLAAGTGPTASAGQQARPGAVQRPSGKFMVMGQVEGKLGSHSAGKGRGWASAR